MAPRARRRSRQRGRAGEPRAARPDAVFGSLAAGLARRFAVPTTGSWLAFTTTYAAGVAIVASASDAAATAPGAVTRAALVGALVAGAGAGAGLRRAGWLRGRRPGACLRAQRRPEARGSDRPGALGRGRARLLCLDRGRVVGHRGRGGRALTPTPSAPSRLASGRPRTRPRLPSGEPRGSPVPGLPWGRERSTRRGTSRRVPRLLPLLGPSRTPQVAFSCWHRSSRARACAGARPPAGRATRVRRSGCGRRRRRRPRRRSGSRGSLGAGASRRVAGRDAIWLALLVALGRRSPLRGEAGCL